MGVLMTDCEICGNDIIEINRKVVEEWSDERKRLHFWYWCGVTDHGKSELSPYDTDLVYKFDKHCGLK